MAVGVLAGGAFFRGLENWRLRMHIFQQLREQHAQLRELAQVLLIMNKHEGLRHTSIYQELSARVEDLVKAHLDLEDKEIYAELLQNAEGEIKTISRNLFSGANYLKKLFNEYQTKQKKYRQRSNLDPSLDEQAAKESRDMLRLLLEHISLEEQHFFPLLEDTDSAGRGGLA
jgi:hemerythrin-like domain-containing protein